MISVNHTAQVVGKNLLRNIPMLPCSLIIIIGEHKKYNTFHIIISENILVLEGEGKKLQTYGI